MVSIFALSYATRRADLTLKAVPWGVAVTSVSVIRGPVPWIVVLLVAWVLPRPAGNAHPAPQQAGTQQSETVPSTSPSRTTGPQSGRQQTTEPAPSGGGGGFGGGVSFDLSQLFGPRKPDIDKVLDKKGPQFPDTFTMSSFGVQAFVRGDWPVILEYELEQSSLIMVTIAAPDVQPAYYRLDGSKQRGSVILHIPERFGSKPVPGWYLIRALSTNVGEIKPVHFHILALGAGDKAVGSATIDQLAFQQQLLDTQQKEKVAYSFHSLSDFDDVEVEFPKGMLYSTDRLIVQEKVKVESISGGVERNAVVRRSWDGKGDNGKYSPGTHYMVVRAWRGLKSGADWITVWSPQVLRVE